MSFIAGVAYEREKPYGDEQWVRIGKVWYDSINHHASLMLHGFRFGHFVAKPYNQDEAPYIKGDLNILTGEYKKEGSLIKDYLKCGFIYTESDQRGAIYQIRLDVNPLPVLMAKAINSKSEVKPGMFLSVHLEDKDERTKVESKAIDWSKERESMESETPLPF